VLPISRNNTLTVSGDYASRPLPHLLLNYRLSIQFYPASPASKLPSPPHRVVEPDSDSTFLLSGAITQDKPPLASNQTRSINGVAANRLQSAIPHRLTPFLTVGGNITEFEADDTVAGFVQDRLAAVLLRSSRPQRNTQTDSGLVRDRAIHPIAHSSSEAAVKFDLNRLSKFGDFVPFASKANPSSNLVVINVVPLQWRSTESGFDPFHSIQEVHLRFFHRS
jgi:hypothetical protein